LWLVWRSGNGVCHTNKVKVRRARLVLGLVTIFGGSTNPVFSTLLRPTQPCHSSLGRRSDYVRRFRPPLGKKRRVLRSSRPCYQDLCLPVVESSPKWPIMCWMGR